MDKRTVSVAGITPAIKVLVSVEEAAVMFSLGRTFVYELVMRREICSIKVGRTRRILVSSLHEYVDRLMAQAS